jgi:hypothetical protein
LEGGDLMLIKELVFDRGLLSNPTSSGLLIIPSPLVWISPPDRLNGAIGFKEKDPYEHKNTYWFFEFNYFAPLFVNLKMSLEYIFSHGGPRQVGRLGGPEWVLKPLPNIQEMMEGMSIQGDLQAKVMFNALENWLFDYVSKQLKRRFTSHVLADDPMISFSLGQLSNKLDSAQIRYLAKQDMSIRPIGLLVLPKISQPKSFYRLTKLNLSNRKVIRIPAKGRKGKIHLPLASGEYLVEFVSGTSILAKERIYLISGAAQELSLNFEKKDKKVSGFRKHPVQPIDWKSPILQRQILEPFKKIKK